MGENSAIEWTDATWNPWHGCRKISQGCKNCYMFREKRQYGQDPELVVRSKTKFRDPLKWKSPARVFTCSWSDWFIEEADAWRDEAWDVIRATPHLTYQILTKRIERADGHLPHDWPLPNVWLGVSIANQADADKNIPLLLQTPAAIRFLSCEPLLGPVDLSKWIAPRDAWQGHHLRCCPLSYAEVRANIFHPPCKCLHWVIVGGESGPGARPMHPRWVRDLRDQCVAAAVPLHFKQHGEWIATEFSTLDHDELEAKIGYVNASGRLYGSSWTFADVPDLTSQDDDWQEVLRVGKKAAGRLLDGRTWDEFPEVAR